MCDQYLGCKSFVYDISTGYCTLNKLCDADSTRTSSGKKFYEKGMIALGKVLNAPYKGKWLYKFVSACKILSIL